MRICVVGAGAAGLCAARHVSAVDTVVVYEQTDTLGGTWVYTEATDHYPDTGLPVHSSMYKSLRTNLPKEVMGFPDFPIPEQELSYLPAADILHFLNLYADHFDLRKHIKLQHHVKKILPSGKGWSVTVTNLKTHHHSTDYFDAVMICNGHYHTPQMPSIPGMNTFPGHQLHSHDYREAASMASKRVVVLGAGPSGMDLALEISKLAKQVVLSHHLKEEILTKFPDNLVQRPDIVSVDGSIVTFQDGSQTEADVLFYCTGYKYSFPFLDKSCGVSIEDNCVQPLYKHLIYIHKPTLCFIGLPFYVCAFTMFDIQTRYFLRFIHHQMAIPSAEEMLKHTNVEIAELKSRGLKLRQFHMMGPRQGEYYDSLTTEAGLPPTPPVLTSLHNFSSQRFLDDLLHYRQDVFRIVDDTTFVQVK